MKFIGALAVLLSVFSSGESQLAETQYGWIQGRARLNENGWNYYSFERVPYARQPIGALRFRVSIKLL